MKAEKIYPITKINTEDTKIEINCRAVKPVLLYFEEKYGRKQLEEFIYNTQMNLPYLEDTNNWVSYSYFCRLLERLVKYTGDPQSPYLAGIYSAKKECYGTLENFFYRFGTPGGTYKLMAEFASRCTKIDRFEIVNLKRNTCTIKLRFLGKYKQDKNNCLNVQGMLAAIPTLLGLPSAKVKETQCAARGKDICLYEVSWQNRPSHLFGLMGMLGGLTLVYGIKTFMNVDSNIFSLTTVVFMGYLIGRLKDYKINLKNSVANNEKESKDLLESVVTIEKLNIDLQKKVEQRTEELQRALEELKNSQTQLIQSEKMASVGRLAAGMAHELNNPVGALRNYIQDVLEDIPEDDSKWERLKKAEKVTGRCKRLVSDLLTFSRESKELEFIDINDIVETIFINIKNEISNTKIKVEKKLRPNLPKVKVDPLQIQQVFMNIIMNASDAIRDDGKIVITSTEETENIIVEISDTGEGMPDNIQDKIFDPFFTTKSPGKGMGLGLAISYNIIKRFNGNIRVKSEMHKGTTFVVTLPVVNK